jgi:multidrug efflux pump subunit AcrB
MKKIYKQFGLSTGALKNVNTVKLLIALLTIGGLYSYLNMPREAFPDVAAPEVFVTTPYPGNSAEDIENLITRPLETEFKKISGIDEIKSTSKAGFSSIDVKFTFDVDPDKALADVKDKIDDAMGDKEWPSDLPQDPKAMKLDFSELKPIMNVNISGDYKAEKLKKFAEYLQDKIEQLPQISAADIRGVQDKEVEISVDLNQMVSRNISFNNIEQAVKNENLTISAGDIKEGGIRRNVRVIGEFTNPKDIENIVIRKAKDKITYLRDVAKVYYKQQESESYAREFGNPVVMLDIKKRSGANQIEASDEIKKIIEKTKATVFPENLRVTITNDLSNRTRAQVADLENSIILGMILVVVVLMFFMGFRNALFVGIAIPLSMLMSFLILSSMGVTLNTMVLFALVLALGMLVDNGIVIVENIYRFRQEGYKAFEAAKYAVGEVAWPIIASTATTLAAFIPLAFWPGIIGEFMQYLPITLIIVLSSSLFVALVINPVLTMDYMSLKEQAMPKYKVWRRFIIFLILGILMFILKYSWINIRKPQLSGVFNAIGLLLILLAIWQLLYNLVLVNTIQWFQNRFLPWLEYVYEKLLRMALRGKNVYLFFFGTVLLLVLSGLMLKIFPPKKSFFPNTQPNQIYVYIEHPIGTDIEVVNEFTRKITRKINRYFDENDYNYLLTSIIEQVGEGTGDPQKGPQGGKTPNRSKIILDFVDFKYRKGVNTSDVLNDIRELIQGYAGIKISADKDQHKPPTGAPVDLELVGDDYDKLLTEAVKIKKYLDNAHIPGIEELQIDVDKNKPELPVYVDKEKAGRLGIKTGQIGMALRTSIYGKEIDRFKDGDDDYPINIRLAKQYRYDRQSLLDQKIVYRDQQSGKIISVPVSAVATMKSASSFSAIKRKDLKRVIAITSNVLEGYNANEIVEKLNQKMKQYQLPDDISYQFLGEQKEMKKNMGFLSKALMIAIFMIFLILVTQFNSMTTPVIILLTVVLSMIGVFLGLIIMRQDFIVVMTMIGIISLAGIVVNNAIVLLDYTLLTIKRKRLEAGLEEDDITPNKLVFESLVEAGKTRLRPVLLTAITTVLGLIPLAIGLNIDFIGLFTHFDPDIYLGGENVAFWGPIAKAVINGLSFATFLTLVIVPVMFYIQFRLISKNKKL